MVVRSHEHGSYACTSSRGKRGTEPGDLPLLRYERHLHANDHGDQTEHDGVGDLEVPKSLGELPEDCADRKVFSRCRPNHVVSKYVGHEREENVQRPKGDSQLREKS